MKKDHLLNVFLLLALFLTFCATKAMAQDSGKPVRFGVKIGMSSSGFTHHQEIFTYKKLGFAGGGFVEFQSQKPVSLALEVNYQQEGAFHLDPRYIYPEDEMGIGNIYKNASDITLHTINVPLMINLRPLREGNVLPRLSLGFSVDWIFSAQTKDLLTMYNPSNANNAYYVTLPEREKENVSSSFKSINYGPLAGLGIDFKSGSLVYSFETRYSMGLNHINNLGTLNNVGTNTYRYAFSSNTFTVLAGISF